MWNIWETRSCQRRPIYPWEAADLQNSWLGTIVPEGENDSPVSVSSKSPQRSRALSFYTKQPLLWWPVNLTGSPFWEVLGKASQLLLLMTICECPRSLHSLGSLGSNPGHDWSPCPPIHTVAHPFIVCVSEGPTEKGAWLCRLNTAFWVYVYFRTKALFWNR